MEYLPNDGFSVEEQNALDIVQDLQTGSDNPVAKLQSKKLAKFQILEVEPESQPITHSSIIN